MSLERDLVPRPLNSALYIIDDMSERDRIKTEIFKLIAGVRLFPPTRLNENSDLYRDLKIWSDAVDDLFIGFSEELNFPLRDVDVRRCFPGEAHMFNPWPPLFFKPKRRLRVRHLIDAACTKTWLDLEEV